MTERMRKLLLIIKARQVEREAEGILPSVFDIGRMAAMSEGPLYEAIYAMRDMKLLKLSHQGPWAALKVKLTARAEELLPRVRELNQ